MQMQFTPKGVAELAQMLFEDGYLAEEHRNKVIWLYESGIGFENEQFKQQWKFVRAAAHKAVVNGSN